MLKARFCPYRLAFKKLAITSRDKMSHKDTFLFQVWDETSPDVVGTGEIALFKGLSADDSPDFVELVRQELSQINSFNVSQCRSSSIMFGVETALANLANGGTCVFPSAFTQDDVKLPINGLVWMGDFRDMRKSIEEKIEQGFHCIKLKIGGINIDDEISLVRYIRTQFPSSDLTIRLDANCSFKNYSFDDACSLMERLSAYDIHSIEQPFAVVQIEETARMSEKHIIPIALDEQLIGVNSKEEKKQILDHTTPQFIVLKPSLCGGFAHAREWIEIARERNIGWWITSALESAIGLNAIVQWTATWDVAIPQGLGTGELYMNDFSGPITRQGEWLRFNAAVSQWVLPENLPWIYV